MLLFFVSRCKSCQKGGLSEMSISGCKSCYWFPMNRDQIVSFFPSSPFPLLTKSLRCGCFLYPLLMNTIIYKGLTPVLDSKNYLKHKRLVKLFRSTSSQWKITLAWRAVPLHSDYSSQVLAINKKSLLIQFFLVFLQFNYIYYYGRLQKYYYLQFQRNRASEYGGFCPSQHPCRSE